MLAILLVLIQLQEIKLPTIIANKKNEVTLKLEELINTYNSLTNERVKIYNEILQLQGAVKALNEVDGDQSTDSTPS